MKQKAGDYLPRGHVRHTPVRRRGGQCSGRGGPTVSVDCENLHAESLGPHTLIVRQDKRDGKLRMVKSRHASVLHI